LGAFDSDFLLAAVTLGKAYPGDDAAAAEQLALALKRARALIRAEWPSIGAVAEALMMHGKLAYEDVEAAIVGRIIGGKGSAK
jgi:hypothetical protein